MVCFTLRRLVMPDSRTFAGIERQISRRHRIM
jgi:hypothetical protein